jgi:hypothetical protein
MRVDPTQRHASVFEFGRELLEFGSPLGRQFWQRYYATPPINKPKGTAKMSSFGIPLVHRMAEGEVPISAATVQVSFSKTTAVAQAPEVTLREGADSIPIDVATTSGGPTAVSQTGPSGRDWAKQPSKLEVVRTPDPAAQSVVEETTRGRRRRFWIGAGLASTLACGILVALLASRVRHRDVEQAPVRQPAALVPAITNPAPAAPQPVVPIPTSARPSRAPALPLEPIQPASASTSASEAPKPKHHHHSRPAGTTEWSKDPQGNVIPPP